MSARANEDSERRIREHRPATQRASYVPPELAFIEQTRGRDCRPRLIRFDPTVRDRDILVEPLVHAERRRENVIRWVHECLAG